MMITTKLGFNPCTNTKYSSLDFTPIFPPTSTSKIISIKMIFSLIKVIYISNYLLIATKDTTYFIYFTKIPWLAREDYLFYS